MKMQTQFTDVRSRKEESERGGYRKVISWYALLLLAAVILVVPAAASAYVSVSVTLAPPPLPVYTQPPCPAPGSIWVPGYWAWDPVSGYYWVPGLWAPAPFIGALWTPGYWAWSDGVYVWNEGYWGPVVGFYGGINYGFGYAGSGYYGGYWSGGSYYYNSTVNNVNVTNITNVYTRSVTNVQPSGASFNGGRGTTARPTPEQMAAAHQRHFAPTAEQKHQMQIARTNPGQRASENHGLPLVAATVKPGAFSGRGVVSAVRTTAAFKTAPTDIGRAQVREHVPVQKRVAPIRHPAPRPEYGNPGYAAPRYAFRQPEHPAVKNPWQQQVPGPGYNHPRIQHQSPQPTGPLTRRESAGGEGREFR